MLNDVVVKQKYQVRLVKGLAFLKNLGTDIDISGAYQSIIQNVKVSAKLRLGYYTSVQHKRRTKNTQDCYSKENRLNCSGFRMQTK